MTSNIQVIQAPAPTDILWENIGLSTTEILKRRLVTIILSLIILGACFGMVLGLKVAQDKAAKNQAASATNGQLTSTLGVRILSIVISLLILIINNVLAIVLQKLTIYERHSDHTDKNRSMILKICVSQFINTCLLIVAVHAIIIKPKNRIDTKGRLRIFHPISNLLGGVLIDAFFILISDLYLSPLLTLFDPMYFMKLCKRSKLKEELTKPNNNSSMIQKDANEIMKGQELDPASLYSKVIKIYLQSIFFMPILPIAPLIAFVAIFINYWVQKYVLLRRAARPISIGHKIVETCVLFIKITPLILGVGVSKVPLTILARHSYFRQHSWSQGRGSRNNHDHLWAHHHHTDSSFHGFDRRLFQTEVLQHEDCGKEQIHLLLRA